MLCLLKRIKKENRFCPNNEGKNYREIPKSIDGKRKHDIKGNKSPTSRIKFANRQFMSAFSIEFNIKICYNKLKIAKNAKEYFSCRKKTNRS